MEDPEVGGDVGKSLVAPVFRVGVGEIEKRRGAYLPHWSREGAAYFVTFRLDDAVPKAVAAEWKEERDRLAKLIERKLISPKEEFEYRRLHSEKIETYLDAGRGSCILRDPKAARVIHNAMLFFDGLRYELDASCVMPNHVHAILRPNENYSLDKILHSWKSYSANKINEALGQRGQVWQEEYYDHLIRDQADSDRCFKYVLENPGKAGLQNWHWCHVGEREGSG